MCHYPSLLIFLPVYTPSTQHRLLYFSKLHRDSKSLLPTLSYSRNPHYFTIHLTHPIPKPFPPVLTPKDGCLGLWPLPIGSKPRHNGANLSLSRNTRQRPRLHLLVPRKRCPGHRKAQHRSLPPIAHLIPRHAMGSWYTFQALNLTFPQASRHLWIATRLSRTTEANSHSTQAPSTSAPSRCNSAATIARRTCTSYAPHSSTRPCTTRRSSKWRPDCKATERTGRRGSLRVQS